jgi:hypothetical protein
MQLEFPLEIGITYNLTKSAYFVSLMFCVLDNNIRNFKCVLSGASFSAQEMAKSLEWRHPDMGAG